LIETREDATRAAEALAARCLESTLNDAISTAAAEKELAVREAILAAEEVAAAAAITASKESEAALSMARRDAELAVEAAVQHNASMMEDERIKAAQVRSIVTLVSTRPLSQQRAQDATGLTIKSFLIPIRCI